MDVNVKKGGEVTASCQFDDSPDLSSATMSFAAKTDRDNTAKDITKVHDDFDMTDAGTGLVLFDLDDADTGTAGTMGGEVVALFSATSKAITKTITIWIEESYA